MENKKIFHGFSSNRNAIPFLEKFLEENPEKLDWIRWDWLSRNENASPILEKHVDKIDWYQLSMSRSPWAFSLIEKHFELVKDLLNWDYFSANPLAISLLEQNRDKIDWYGLCFNSHPRAIGLFAQHPEKLTRWDYFSSKQNISLLILSNLEQVDWKSLTSNPNIFKVEEDFLKKRTDLFREELMQKALHPRRIAPLLDQEGELENYI